MSEVRKLDEILQLVEEYAVAVTKRFGQSTCDEYHLLLAIDEYKSAHFTSLMPGVATACRTRLAANATSQLVEDVDTRIVRKIFRAVATIDEFWAKTQSLATEMVSGDKTSKSAELESGSRNTLQINTPLTPGKDDPTSDAFLAWCASTAVIEEALVREQVGEDLKEISRLVDGAEETALELGEAEQHRSFGSVFATLRSLPSSAGNLSVSQRLARSYINYAVAQASATEQCTPERALDIREGLTVFLRTRLVAGALRNAEVSEVFNRHFDDLYGLESVKRELLRHVRSLVAQQLREQRGLRATTMTMHLAFLGSPGTGKTEVARRYGKVLKELGLLETGEFNEVGKSDFVAKWAGQTEDKTKKLIRKAKGGVLFIDEAYALYEGNRDNTWKGYGQEAIQVLVADIENFRKELLVIVAGYAKEMEDFFNANDGLRSRIPTLITFPDLSLDELTNIGLMMISQAEFDVDGSFKSALEDAIAKRMTQKDFGNGRGVRNLIDEVRRMQDERLSELGEFVTEAELNTLIAEDIPELTAGSGEASSARRPIGYR